MAGDQEKSKETLLQELAALRAEVAALKAANGSPFESIYPSPPDTNEAQARPLILIVEDDPIMHGLLELLLGLKYQVASAFEGGEGLEKALELSPDLIMVDVMMPGMSGDQLVMELRRRPVFDDVPLIVLTAKADDQLRLLMLSSNIQAYLNKPFENEEVQIWVDNLITRRLQLQKERRRQGERLRFHVENSPLGVIETDAELRITYWSPRAEEMFGWAAAEVIGKRPEEFRFIHEEDLEAFARLQEQWRKGEETRIITTNRNYRKDGAMLYCQWYNSVLMDISGRPLSLLSLVHDITGLKEAEQSLQEAKASLELRVARRTEELRVVNEQLLRALEIRQQTEVQLRANQELLDSVLNSSLDAIVALDPIRDEAGRVVDFEWSLANPRGAMLIQASVEALKGARLLALMPGIIRSGLFGRYVEVVETGIPFRTEVFYDYDHIRGWFDLMVVKRGPGIAITARDMTQQKGDQEAIRHLNHILARRATELERANEGLKEFSYSISHDLRAPLRAISGFAQIIQRRHLHHLNQEGQRYLNNILMASHHMGRLLDDLLIYTRLGREPLQIEPVNLVDILANIKESYYRQLERLEATLVLPSAMPPVRGDRVLLSRLFTNLIDNALKYHLPEASPLVEVGYQVEDGSMVVYVQDNGLGIAAEYHQQIFNLFQRLHSLEDYPGTGLGLAIVKRSAQLMNGDVWLDSTPDQGSVFYVRLLLA